MMLVYAIPLSDLTCTAAGDIEGAQGQWQGVDQVGYHPPYLRETTAFQPRMERGDRCNDNIIMVGDHYLYYYISCRELYIIVLTARHVLLIAHTP